MYGMNTKMIKKCSDYLLESLADLINACFQQEIVTSIMKISKVIPACKSGDPENPRNYRLILIILVLSKLLESAVLSRLVFFLEKNNILALNQFGFRKGLSRRDAIMA